MHDRQRPSRHRGARHAGAAADSSVNPAAKLLDEVLTPRRLTHVIQTVLGSIPRLPAELADMITAIRSGLEVPGFRPGQAPVEVIAPQLAEKVRRNPGVLSVYLRAWVAGQDALRRRVADELVARSIPHENEFRVAGPDFAPWPRSGLAPIVDAISGTAESPSQDDVMLMICCLTRRFPAPDGQSTGLSPVSEPPAAEAEPPRKQHDLAPASASRLEAWLVELGAAPPDAPEWREGEIERFTARLLDLAQEKRRAVTTRRIAAERLDEVRRAATEFASFFGWGDLADWSIDRVEATELESLVKELEDFLSHLNEYRELRAEGQATTVAAARQRRKHEEAVEQVLIDTHDRLQRLLIPEGPDAPDLTLPADAAPGPASAEADVGAVEPVTGPFIPDTVPAGAPGTAAVPEASLVAAHQDQVLADPAIEPAVETPAANDPVAEPTAGGAVSSLGLAVPATEMATTAEPATGETPVDDSSVPAITGAPLASETFLPPGRPPLADEPRQAEHEADVRLADTSPAVIASRLTAGSPGHAWDEFVWSLIAADDLPAAYWCVRSRRASGQPLALDDWLVAAAQGAAWIEPGDAILIDDLLAIAQQHQPSHEGAAALLSLAAAVETALIAPAAGLIGWLRAPDGLTELDPIVAALRDFSVNGIALDPADLLGVAGEEQRRQELERLAGAATAWLEGAHGGRHSYAPAVTIWRHLISPEGDLHALLAPVSRNDRGRVRQVREVLAAWQPDAIDDRIDRLRRDLIGHRAPQIVSHAKAYLMREIGDACKVARSWCDLVERESALAGRGRWFQNSVALMRERISGAWPAADARLTALVSAPQPVDIAAAARRLALALGRIRRLLQFEPADERVAGSDRAGRSWYCADAASLDVALGRRLLWLPELDLDDDGLPRDDALNEVAPALRSAIAEGRTTAMAIGGWLERQDYRFVDRLLDTLRDEASVAELSRRCQEQRAGSMAALRDQQGRTEAEIEQALVDGVISEEDRSALSAEVAGIQPEGVAAFPEAFGQIKRVRRRLAEARQQRLEHLRADWSELERELGFAQQIGPDQQEQVREAVSGALEAGDPRLVDEWLAHLREALDTQTELDVEWLHQAGRPVSRDVLDQYLKEVPHVLEGIQRGPLAVVIGLDRQRSGTRTPQGPLRSLPAARRDEAEEAEQAWTALRRLGSKERIDLLRRHVATLLRFLGFALADNPAQAITDLEQGDDYLSAVVTMSASNLARPIPQFGSQTRDRYDLICLWEGPGADTVAARLRQLGLSTRSVLVLYLGALTLRQRRDLTRISRDQSLAIAVLDTTLLVFLTRERDARLPVFLRCALPFATLSPYTPFQAGQVPAEMFFGRSEMVRQLQDPAGSCLVYGGRQLGKSALLRHVEREFHAPERQQYARYEDIKLIGDPHAAQPPDALWARLRDGLRAAGILSSRVTTGLPEEIAQHILTAVLERPGRRVIVLLDEADNFLDADAGQGFAVVERLRMLMVETERQFKVVFAGLHNVQRFQGIPNQPLAHFGMPLCVGPLEPRDAQRLVREPIEALGFRFDAPASVLRILSYTNYHPGLIQFFCQELLRRQHERRVAHDPPYTIAQSDVEAVYRMPEVRERIRERFDLTLALDGRYQAIAWALVQDQLALKDSFARAYEPNAIDRLARGWWPQGFADVGADQFRGLLDEMCGLGVLVRAVDGRYRLRSPNLVRLMGTEESIEDRLLDLAQRKPPIAFDADGHHPLLDEAEWRYSPLTHAQSRLLAQPRFGVGLVFASEALGLASVPDAFRSYVPGADSRAPGAFIELDAEIETDRDLQEALRAALARPERPQAVVALLRATDDAEATARLVEAGLDFCRRSGQTSKRWLRLLVLFDAAATWAWLCLPAERRSDLENRADAAPVAPRRWTLSGVRQRLRQQSMVDMDPAGNRILAATGGWPLLLDELFSRCRGSDDPRPAADEIERDLANEGSEVRRRWLAGLGHDVAPAVRATLQFISAEKERTISADLITPDFIDADPPLTPADCDAAVEYLVRLGCVDRRDDLLQVEPTVVRVVRP